MRLDEDIADAEEVSFGNRLRQERLECTASEVRAVGTSLVDHEIPAISQLEDGVATADAPVGDRNVAVVLPSDDDDFLRERQGAAIMSLVLRVHDDREHAATLARESAHFSVDSRVGPRLERDVRTPSARASFLPFARNQFYALADGLRGGLSGGLLLRCPVAAGRISA